MKIDELTNQDKNMDFKPLNIQKEVQDNIMDCFQFTDVGQMFESGVLTLETLAMAKRSGIKKAYFVTESGGREYFYEWNFLKLIEQIKDPNRSTESTHKVVIQPKTAVQNNEKNTQQN